VSANTQEPSREQLLAMAYVDGELNEAERADFERELSARLDLRREVVQLRRLELLARHAAPAEPMDHEWRRLERDPLHRGSTLLGFAGLAVGAIGLAGYGAWSLWTSTMETTPKLLLGALCLGALLLFLATLRARLRTLPFDPYTEIER